ncbi:nose resistant to fluoxetine protein 6-like [Solenopsis invicta]|nr:nose resistant to fluoxetine protein 6-like [Solenopsis invicta]
MLYQRHQFIWYICANLVALLCVSVHTWEFNDTHIQTLSAYGIASKANVLNSTTCGKELQDFRDAIDQRILWSLKILDSSGGFKPGFLYGNNYWLGSRSQCLDTMNRSLSMSSRIILNNMQYRDLQKEFPPFDINYFVAHFRYNSTFQYHIRMFTEDVITLGFCLPASCSTSNLSFILERIIQDKIILRYDLHFTDIHLIRVKNLKDDDKLSGGAFLYICIGLGLCFMTTIGTIYDIFIQKNLKKNDMNKINNDIKDVSREIRTEVNLPLYEKSVIGEVLTCFSAYTNTKKLFSTKLDVGTIPAIHGLKFINMCFIISMHCFYFTVDSIGK